MGREAPLTHTIIRPENCLIVILSYTEVIRHIGTTKKSGYPLINFKCKIGGSNSALQFCEL